LQNRETVGYITEISTSNSSLSAIVQIASIIAGF